MEGYDLLVRRNLKKLQWGMLLIPLFLYSPRLQSQNTPKYSNEFLAIGVGARALAMSNAMTSVADDATAAYWNPAALTDIEYAHQFTAQHAAYFAGTANYDYISYAGAIDSYSHFALSIIRLGIDDIPDTRFLFDDNGRLNYDNIDFFSAQDYAFILSYASSVGLIFGNEFGRGLTFGVNFKVIRRKVGDFADAWGFGIDAAMKYRHYDWDFGIMIRDVSTTFNSWTINQANLAAIFSQTNNDLPGNSLEITLPKLIAGASRTFRINEKIGVLTSADLVFSFDGRRNTLVKTGFASFEPQLGFELDYEDRFFVRMGIGNFQRIKEFTRVDGGSGQTYWAFQPNMGLGIKLDDLVIDYALTDIGNVAESPYSHVFSLKYSLDALSGMYAKDKRKERDGEGK
ncbi:hypothetical protein [Roseivirga sp.]|uniref:putative type IX sorting system protein PorV2 n=1 Tax=Roseivirga sp. TaxID=1964215 RepID=UPI002B26FB78|nr:hypothetical protein [Roseivirga sp.]